MMSHRLRHFAVALPMILLHILVLAFCSDSYAVDALISPGVFVPMKHNNKLMGASSASIRSVGLMKSSSNKSNNNNIQNDDGEEIFSYDQRSRFLSQSSSANITANYMDDLTPPEINWARDSILFSENPATKRNNAVVETWRLCRLYLPPVFTGTWSWRDPGITDRNPLGAIYNMIVVRIPTMGISVVYIKNLLEGHPLIMDFGQGAFEMSPVVVLSVLALILA